MQPLTRSRPRPRFFGTSGPSFALDFVNGTNALDPRVTFTRASSATYFDSAGVLQSAANDVPRFDYNPSTLAAQGLLIEESRTNLLTYSAEFDNAAWSKTRSSITANATTSPDGTANADKLVEDSTASNTHQTTQGFAKATAAIQYTASLYVKASERTFCVVALTDAGGFVVAGINLSTGAAQINGTSGWTSATVSSQTVSNGWYRFQITATSTANNTVNMIVRTATAINVDSYTGDGTSGIYIWGAQLEAGAFPTSYIPTTTTSLTRSADIASVTTLSPWFNASAGTLYAEYNIPFALPAGAGPRLATLIGAGGAAVDELPLFISQASGKAASANAFTGSVNAGRIDASASFAANTTTKAAYAYASNDRSVTTSGSSPTISTAAYTIPTVTTLRLGQDGGGTNNVNGHIRRITYYNTRLPNAQLQALTAP